MRTIITIFAAGATLLAVGCGSQIGDSCTLDHECSETGERVCLRGSDLPGGYCTVIGCGHDTCPDEAVCVRFFAVGSTGFACDPATEGTSTSDCSPDELCTIGGACVPRSAESRYCMQTCKSHGDCRDGYECRTRELMIQNGGEPVPPPGERLGDDVQGFCAAALPQAALSSQAALP